MVIIILWWVTLSQLMKVQNHSREAICHALLEKKKFELLVSNSLWREEKKKEGKVLRKYECKWLVGRLIVTCSSARNGHKDAVTRTNSLLTIIIRPSVSSARGLPALVGSLHQTRDELISSSVLAFSINHVIFSSPIPHPPRKSSKGSRSFGQSIKLVQIFRQLTRLETQAIFFSLP